MFRQTQLSKSSKSRPACDEPLSVSWLRPKVSAIRVTKVYAAKNKHSYSGTRTIRAVATVDFPTRWAHFRLLAFELDFEQHGMPRQETALALVLGDIRRSPTLVRIHSQCLTGEALGSLRCDCAPQLDMALSLIAREGSGVLVYEQQEGRGIGLMAKLRAYELQDQGLDTVEANERLGFKSDYRDYRLPVEILNYLGIQQIRLISDNADKIAAVEREGIRVVERIPCQVTIRKSVERNKRNRKLQFDYPLEGHLFAGPSLWLCNLRGNA
jgi:GTP cyclohydrolase II